MAGLVSYLLGQDLGLNKNNEKIIRKQKIIGRGFLDMTKEDFRECEDITKKKFNMRPKYEIIGDESSGQVDYAIKESDELICITENKVQQKLTEGFTQNIKQLENEILQASKVPFSIEFIEEALVENSEEYQTLRKDVKKVLGIIIGLLEDRACVENKSDRKRARIEKYCSKK
ncbi:hypothetical protein C1645_740741 [Glomus cerebriforme]|uniref:Uncharacterized protein n=1 Tax=Glomus cerebriforme TaxID=658196 RepID=A0A397SNW2_9GLOM|nr:hypothetical protein C1645_740741 [Glomus cerebriforme]